MNRHFLTIFCTLGLTTSAFGAAMALELDSALRDADLVSRIKVTSVAAAPPNSGYAKLATATVTNSVKGAADGDTVEILSDNGVTCPNVLYAVGDDCIVFAKRRAGGHFETMNISAGQFRVEDGSVRYYSFHRHYASAARYSTFAEMLKEAERMAPADEILAGLRERLRTSK